jgi:hypothetical protein
MRVSSTGRVRMRAVDAGRRGERSLGTGAGPRTKPELTPTSRKYTVRDYLAYTPNNCQDFPLSPDMWQVPNPA